jgi:hypothetical protein
MSYTFSFLNPFEISVNDKKYLYKGLQLFHVELQRNEEPNNWSFEAWQGSAVPDSSQLGKAFKTWRESHFHEADINVMFDVCTKSNNDNSNKMRELLLERIFTHVPESHFEDETYGEKWKTVRSEWKAFIETAHPEHDTFEVHRKAGRGYNYDFDVVYKRDDDPDYRFTLPVEFKFNTPNLYKLPQILSLGCLPNVFLLVSYQEYYYDNYLQEYVALDPEITPIPERSVYLSCVKGSNYNCNPFFQVLKERESFEQKKKAEVVDRSIQTYLERFGPEIRVPDVMKKIHESQANKLFAMWHRGKFTSDSLTLSLETVAATVFHGNTKNTIRLRMPDNREFHMLLRWKNHKGVLLPAWQISIKPASGGGTRRSPRTARRNTVKSKSPKTRR